MTQLKDLSKADYSRIKSMGMLWEFHPEASGNWWEDCGKYQIKSSYDWLKEPQYKNLRILDPDGWNRSDYRNSMSELINELEFNQRVAHSTISWPLSDMLAADKKEIGLVEFTD